VIDRETDKHAKRRTRRETDTETSREILCDDASSVTMMTVKPLRLTASVTDVIDACAERQTGFVWMQNFSRIDKHPISATV